MVTPSNRASHQPPNRSQGKANRFRVAIASALLLFTLPACQTGSQSGLKIGSLLPSTGDLAAVGQPIAATVPLVVEKVNACGGVNGQPVTLVAEDDQSTPSSGAEAMTKLAEVDGVAGVVGSFASGVSNAAVDIAVRNQVMLISPGSTSTIFTERAKKGELQGYWARTAPPDNYQAAALAKLAQDRGYKRVSTVVINNDYGRSFEKEFITSFKKLGGTVVNEANPTRYDERATSFASEAAAAFANKPDAVIAVLYPETGSLLLKAAYERGLTSGVQIMLTDGTKADSFPAQVGKTPDGKYIIAGAIGTVPGADGKGLEAVSQVWQSAQNQPVAAYVPQAWDATALLMLAAEAAKANTGEGIKSKIREVSSGPGEPVTDVCEGLKLLREGKTIKYEGASGDVSIDEYGDVVGTYDVWEVKDDGTIAIVDKVRPELAQAAAK
uniref:Extracellular ligand-binding receptor n=1 Tax=Cyanothece sp. (strain PCC 7425 / ATCC 29141) TaxID=395961 RepID=B8HNM0_CYAP4